MFTFYTNGNTLYNDQNYLFLNLFKPILDYKNSNRYRSNNDSYYWSEVDENVILQSYLGKDMYLDPAQSWNNVLYGKNSGLKEGETNKNVGYVNLTDKKYP